MSITTPPHLTPKSYFGIRTEILNNVHFISESEIIYPAGGTLVIHNHLQKKQRFIKLADRNRQIRSIHVAPNKQWLALNEEGDGDTIKPSITIYDLYTTKRKKILTVPHEYVSKAKMFAVLQFTFDSRYLVAVTGEPDWDLYYYNWEKGKVESHAKAQNSSGVGYITSIQCNPTDATLIVMTGPYTFRIMNVVESVWGQWGWCKADNMDITSSMWLTPDRILFGTSTGLLMVVENGEWKQNCIFKAFDCQEVVMRKAILIEEEDEEQEDKEDSVKEFDSAESLPTDVEVWPVMHLVNFAKGFAFCCGAGYVHMFEKESVLYWRKRNVFRVCRTSYKHTRDYPEWSELDEIQSLIIDPEQSRLVISTLRTQLYEVDLFGTHMLQSPVLPFKEMGPPMHTGSIKSICTCAWKPIFLTAGVDRTVRLWNYQTDEVEFIKIYAEEIHSLALHPTGLFALLGFVDKLRYVTVLIDDLEPQREFAIRSCTKCSFSNNGHFFAATNNRVIQVYSCVSFLNVYNLKGHGGEITGLSWSALDTILVSCGLAGAVYEWSLTTGARVGENILKTNMYKACTVTSDGKFTYAVGTDGDLKEIGSNLMKRQLSVQPKPLDNLVISRSNFMLFTSGGGAVFAIQLPLLDKLLMADYHMHNKRITGIALTYDDLTLITVSEDSSICIWRLTNPEGRAVALEKEFEHSAEILISKKDLQEKLDNIRLLTTRMSEMETENAYHLRQTEAAHIAKLKEVHEGYTSAIQELKEKNENLESDHTYELGTIQRDIVKLKTEHDKALNQMEAEFNIRLINEYDKYQILEDKTNRMRLDYESRIEDLKLSKENALRKLRAEYDAIIEEKELQIMELQEAQEQEAQEHELIKASIEDDTDRELLEVRQKYEAELKTERDNNVRLKGEANVVKKKLIAAAKDIDEFKHQIGQLKAEQNQLNNVIRTLERDVSDLKKEISERDETIKEKEKRIQELKRKNHELEKYKFVLTFKIDELKAQIEPLDRDIQVKKLRTLELEDALEALLKKRAQCELRILRLNEKMAAGKNELLHEMERSLALKNMLKKIKIDLHNMSTNISDFNKMKLDIKHLYHKYIDDPDWKKCRAAEEEAVKEFNRQRDHLEAQIASLRAQLARATGANRGDAARLIDENCTLLSEINTLRSELKTVRVKCYEMESLLGVTKRHLPPLVARQKLKTATEHRQKIDEDHNAELNVCADKIAALKEENERLVSKMRCLQTSLNVPERDENPSQHSTASESVILPPRGEADSTATEEASSSSGNNA